MVRKQVKALTVLYLVPCQHFGVYFAPYQILLVMGAVFVLLAIPFLLFYDRTVLPLCNRCLTRQEYASIDCTGVEDALDVTMAQRSELDYLIYNDPLGYADLILNGDPEGYLKNVTGSHGLED